ncbi:DUF948 domain-containing protein [Gammaproteobacteria bacterium]
MSSPSRLVIAVLISILVAVAFGFLLKIMYDMSQSMDRMTRDITAMAADMHRMSGNVAVLTEQVADMRKGVDSMSMDVRGMRVSMERMSGVVESGGKQIEKINPMGIFQQVLPSGR